MDVCGLEAGCLNPSYEGLEKWMSNSGELHGTKLRKVDGAPAWAGGGGKGDAGRWSSTNSGVSRSRLSKASQVGIDPAPFRSRCRNLEENSGRQVERDTSVSLTVSNSGKVPPKSGLGSGDAPMYPRISNCLSLGIGWARTSVRVPGDPRSISKVRHRLAWRVTSFMHD